jgi:hypothetical protein
MIQLSNAWHVKRRRRKPMRLVIKIWVAGMAKAYHVLSPMIRRENRPMLVLVVLQKEANLMQAAPSF